MLGMKEIPEASDDAFLNAEFRPFHGVSQRDGAKGKLRLQGSVQLPLADGDGKNLGRNRENPNLRHADFQAVGSTRLRRHGAGDDDGGFFF